MNYEKKLKRILINSETIFEEEKVGTELFSSNEQVKEIQEVIFLNY